MTTKERAEAVIAKMLKLGYSLEDIEKMLKEEEKKG